MTCKSTTGSNEESKASQAMLISAPNINTEFLEFEAKMNAKYGKEATAMAMKFFALGESTEVNRDKIQRKYTQIGWILNVMAMSIYISYLSYRLKNVEYPILVYSSFFLYFSSLCSHSVAIYHTFCRQ